MASLLEELRGVVDTLPVMFAGKVRCSIHEDELAIGMTWKHDGDEFHCTECFVYENAKCTKSQKGLYEWTGDFAGVINRMRAAVGLPSLSVKEMHEMVSKTYERVIRSQSALLDRGGARPGAYYTHMSVLDQRLWRLYSCRASLKQSSRGCTPLSTAPWSLP